MVTDDPLQRATIAYEKLQIPRVIEGDVIDIGINLLLFGTSQHKVNQTKFSKLLRENVEFNIAQLTENVEQMAKAILAQRLAEEPHVRLFISIVIIKAAFLTRTLESANTTQIALENVLKTKERTNIELFTSEDNPDEIQKRLLVIAVAPDKKSDSRSIIFTEGFPDETMDQ